MRIEAYFQQLREAIDACPVVRSFNVTYDKRGSHEGFIRGEVHFVDGSMLHLREFVDVESGVERLTYVYHYMDPAKNLVFRYDNTGHHKKLNLTHIPSSQSWSNSLNLVSPLLPHFALRSCPPPPPRLTSSYLPAPISPLLQPNQPQGSDNARQVIANIGQFQAPAGDEFLVELIENGVGESDQCRGAEVRRCRGEISLAPLLPESAVEQGSEAGVLANVEKLVNVNTMPR